MKTEEYRETRSKRVHSLSPSDKPSSSKDEDVDDDYSCRQVLDRKIGLLL